MATQNALAVAHPWRAQHTPKGTRESDEAMVTLQSPGLNYVLNVHHTVSHSDRSTYTLWTSALHCAVGGPPRTRRSPATRSVDGRRRESGAAPQQGDRDAACFGPRHNGQLSPSPKALASQRHLWPQGKTMYVFGCSRQTMQSDSLSDSGAATVATVTVGACGSSDECVLSLVHRHLLCAARSLGHAQEANLDRRLEAWPSPSQRSHPRNRLARLFSSACADLDDPVDDGRWRQLWSELWSLRGTLGTR